MGSENVVTSININDFPIEIDDYIFIDFVNR